MEWIMLYFQFICSSWLTDLFGAFKINLTKVTKWDPHDFHFTTRSSFSFKFPPGKGWFELQSAPSYTHTAGQESEHCVPLQWSAGNQQLGSGLRKLFTISYLLQDQLMISVGQKLYLVFMRIPYFAASCSPLVFCWNNTTFQTFMRELGNMHLY